MTEQPQEMLPEQPLKDESQIRMFLNRKNRVFDDLGHFVCAVTTSTMAKRIANALNKYKPGTKGY